MGTVLREAARSNVADGGTSVATLSGGDGGRVLSCDSWHRSGELGSDSVAPTAARDAWVEVGGAGPEPPLVREVAPVDDLVFSKKIGRSRRRGSVEAGLVSLRR